jgi:hypothetical protein
MGFSRHVFTCISFKQLKHIEYGNYIYFYKTYETF